MRQDKSLRCMVSIRSANESTVQPRFGSSSQICSTISLSLQLSKIVSSVYMRASLPRSSTFLISRKSRESRKFRTRVHLLTWCGRTPTPNRATRALLCQREALAICLEWMLSTDFCMRTACPRYSGHTNSAWKATRSFLMGSSARSGAPPTTAIDFKTWPVYLN